MKKIISFILLLCIIFLFSINFISCSNYGYTEIKSFSSTQLSIESTVYVTLKHENIAASEYDENKEDYSLGNLVLSNSILEFKITEKNKAGEKSIDEILDYEGKEFYQKGFGYYYRITVEKVVVDMVLFKELDNGCVELKYNNGTGTEITRQIKTQEYIVTYF